MGNLFGKDPKKLGAYDLPSPHDFIKAEQIKYDKAGKRIIISDVEDVIITHVTATKSMDRTIDKNCHIAYTKKFDRSQLIVGDIVICRPWPLHLICHRICEVGTDAGGRFYRTKGDHPNATIDPQLWRDGHIYGYVFNVTY